MPSLKQATNSISWLPACYIVTFGVVAPSCSGEAEQQQLGRDAFSLGTATVKGSSGGSSLTSPSSWPIYPSFGLLTTAER